MDRVVIVDKPNFCDYIPRYDLIIISKCYYEDQKLFSVLLDHEQEHRRIQRDYGYLGVFHHVWHDWKFRFSLMTNEGCDLYSKYLNLSEKRDYMMIKEILSNLIYIILTIPTILFQLFSCFRILWRVRKK